MAVWFPKFKCDLSVGQTQIPTTTYLLVSPIYKYVWYLLVVFANKNDLYFMDKD